MKYFKQAIRIVALFLCMLSVTKQDTHAAPPQPYCSLLQRCEQRRAAKRMRIALPKPIIHSHVQINKLPLEDFDKQPVAIMYLSESLLIDANNFIRRYFELSKKPMIELSDTPINIAPPTAYIATKTNIDRYVSFKKTNFEEIYTLGQWLKQLDAHFSLLSSSAEALDTLESVRLNYMFYVFQKIHSSKELEELLGESAKTISHSYCMFSKTGCTIVSSKVNSSEMFFLKIHNLALYEFNPDTYKSIKTTKIIDLIFNS